MKIISLQEKCKPQNSQVIAEALDQNQLRVIGNTFDRIDQVMGDVDIPAIDQPLDDAREKVSTMISSKGLLGKLKQKLSLKSTMKDVMAIQVQVVSLFRGMSSIMSIAGKNLQKKMGRGATKQVQGDFEVQGARQVENASVAEALEGDPALERMRGMIEKSLQPKMLQGVKIDPGAAADQILALPVSDFLAFAKRTGAANIKVDIPKEDVVELTDEDAVEDNVSNVNATIQKMTQDPKIASAVKPILTALKGIGVKIPTSVEKAVDKAASKGGPSATGDV